VNIAMKNSLQKLCIPGFVDTNVHREITRRENEKKKYKNTLKKVKR
jgi:hypothetical protein